MFEVNKYDDGLLPVVMKEPSLIKIKLQEQLILLV